MRRIIRLSYEVIEVEDNFDCFKDKAGNTRGPVLYLNESFGKDKDQEAYFIDNLDAKRLFAEIGPALRAAMVEVKKEYGWRRILLERQREEREKEPCSCCGR